MGFRSTSSLAIVVASVLLVFVYIQPAFTTIGEIQDEIFIFRDNADKVTEVNTRLNQLLSEVSSLRQSDVVALENYMPSAVDTLQMMYDIESIAATAGIQVRSMTALESETTSSLQDTDLYNLDISAEEMESLQTLQSVDHTDVELELSGSYEAFKEFLQLAAQNHYPLEVVTLEFGLPSEGESTLSSGAGSNTDGSYALTLRSYAFNYLSNR